MINIHLCILDRTV